MKNLLFALVLLASAAFAIWVAGMDRSTYGMIRRHDAAAFEARLQERGLAAIEAELGAPLLVFLCGPKGTDHAALIDAAVAHGADVQGVPGRDTPLMHAAMWVLVENAEALVRNGARVDARAVDGKRAIDLLGEGGDAARHARMLALLTPVDER